MKKVQINPISFSPVVRTWSREKFLAICGPQFPDHDLEAYANDMGLISEPVAEEAPAAIPSLIEGGEVLGVAQAEELPNDTVTSSDKTSKRKGGKK